MKKYFESTALLTLFLSVGLSGAVHANPQDGVVSAGSATISSAGKKLDIHQGSQKVVIDWRSFNIAPDEHTQFHQPNSNAMALNRINSGDASQIMGKLTASGNVMIINPSGVVFGKDSKVDVNGLVATTSNISNADFMAGNLKFTPGGNANAAITNHGTITAKEAGLVGLVAPQVNNSGTITAKLGKVQLASGDSFNVDMYGDGLINVAISDDVTRQIVSNSGTINAKGGLITMSAAAGAQVVNNLINNEGTLDASSVSEQGGKIIIGGDVVMNTGTMDASGSTGGSVSVAGRNVGQMGKISADGKTGAGGSATINYTNSYGDVETTKVSAKGTNGAGGTIKIVGTESASRAFISGEYDASSGNAKGGMVEITAKDGDLKLFGARVKASGKTGGGEILVGGDYQGTGTTAHAQTTGINFATTLSANATGNGKGGKVVVWSDKETLFGGSATAKGGTTGGDGGLIEISSKDTMKIAGNAKTDASAAYGAAGQLLLDPKNIIIATGGITGGGGISSFEFVDPDPDAGAFGEYKYFLTNGNILIHDHLDDTVATDAGAIYIYNTATGARISSLYGASADDRIGDAGGYSSYMALEGNDNFLITSNSWDNGGQADAGAVTWINGVTGLNGIVGSSNSLVGSTADDGVNMHATGLSNGNYVVSSRYWDNAGQADAGAVTWGSGIAGVSGVIGVGNSFVGTTASDRVGAIIGLTNGNYVIASYNWHNAGLVNAGAVTWADGTAPITGTINAGNSLIGTKAHDYVGPSVYEVGNSNYVVFSPEWSDGVHTEVGALTWGSGTSGVAGPVSVSNSLIGSYDFEGFGGVNVLANGNYVYLNDEWSNGGTMADAGSVTWMDGNVGLSGVISSANSLVGEYAGHQIGYGMRELDNGNYVLMNPYWDDGVGNRMGAITWASGTSALSGHINATNSLVGAQSGDRVGEYDIVQLTNHNYVFITPTWDNGGFIDAGAVTWGSGTGPTTGVISTLNSVVGGSSFDSIGYDPFMGTRLIDILDNGNYLVGSPYWDNMGITDAGAATLLSGAGPSTGTVSAMNSLVGGQQDDRVGIKMNGLSNGNYIVQSYYWNNGGIAEAGAITWGNGAGGTTGLVTTSNSLVGGTTGDHVGSYYVMSLADDKFLIVSDVWDNGAEVDVGALTWFDGNVGIATGLLSAANSFVGSTSFDDFGGASIAELGNGNYVIGTPKWDNMGIVDAGASTWFDGSIGIFGEIDATTSLVGTSAGDEIGAWMAFVDNNNYVLVNSNWDNGGDADVGAVTWVDGSTGIVGTINDTNSLIGSTAGDRLSSEGLFVMANGTYAVKSAYYTDGGNAEAGAVTFLDSNSPTSGYINSTNSFIGPAAYSGMDWGEMDYTNDRVIISFLGLQQVFSLSSGGGGLGSYDSYSDFATSTITLDPSFIESVLNGGTAVTLQASNDITVTDAITANNAGGDGGTLTLQAGRSIFVNADITTDDGDLYLYGNERLSTGVVNAQRDAGNAVISMGAGVTLNAGTGNVNIRLDTGAGKTHRGAGDITLRDIIADTITVVNRNAGGDVVLESGTLDASGAGTSILLSSLRNFINNSGNTALSVQPGANWLVYSTRATQNIDGGLLSDYTLDGCLYAGPCPALQAGNAFLYSYDPNAPVVTPATPPAAVVPPTVLYVSQTPWRAVYGMAQPVLDIGTIDLSSMTLLNGDGFTNDWIWVDPAVKLWFGLDVDKI